MRLIDADALMELYDMGKELEEYAGVLHVPISVIRQNIKDIPTIEAEPVKHGRWVEGDWTGEVRCYYINRDHGNRSHLCEHTPLNCWNCHMNEVKDKRKKKCSACGEQERFERHYCPNCGAKMDLEE